MIKGDVFHDGLLGLWVLHNKPNGKKLFIIPLEKLTSKKSKGECNNYYHDPKTWNLKGIKVLYNLYK